MARGSARGHHSQSMENSILPPLLNRSVNQYFQQHPASSSTSAWLAAPEIPSGAELSGSTVATGQPSQARVLSGNVVQGPWPSKEAYLQAHYNFLREEATRPVREAVQQVKNMPEACENSFQSTIGIYEQVHIVALVTSTRGVAIRITFSTKRAGKGIRWKQTDRLLTGKLIALTPSNDMFRTKIVVATIAARPLEGLEQNPPELELFFGQASELEIDPATEWTMIEARSSFFEAQRHTMLALQKLMHEPMPMSQLLVNAENDILPPAYLTDGSTIDLAAVSSHAKGFSKIHALDHWPADTATTLDPSQLAALQRIVTRSLAIIQGPPGTGKTFVSVKALQVILANRREGDPPIVVTAQTNHALDQLLRHIAEFEPEFARLGGRTKDRKVIRDRTIHELRNGSKGARALPGCQAPGARKDMARAEKEIEVLIRPLKAGNFPLDVDALRKSNLLSNAQATSLEAGASQWVQTSLSNPAETHSPFNVWLSHGLVKVPYKPSQENFGFDFEEAEVEFEQLMDIEAENAIKEEEYIDALTGSTYTLADNFTCSRKNPINDRTVESLLKKEQDLWKIQEASRPSVYNYLQTQQKHIILKDVRRKTHEYDMAARRARIGNLERDELILRDQKVIGMTTTGLSKYRGLIASLGCKIVLVEEAAETLEAPIIAACMPSLEHLILVGDHQQLRPQCTVKAHEKEPFNYNISMFERLVNNGMGKTTLSEQRRMIPEIRRILRPIYQDVIRDHVSVKDPVHRPDVPGMGGVNSYFFTHSWDEKRDETSSCINVDEADMIVGFVEHLLYNGMHSEEITILTFYNGQRKQIGRALKRSTALTGLRFQIVTVDSYQGEENKVVILSLVRSNKQKSIGFLSVANRICVALSRAQCGLYIFGNGHLLSRNRIWQDVILLMFGKDIEHADEIPALEPRRFNDSLPVHCAKHDHRVIVKEPSDWDSLSGGCAQPCTERLRCGHICILPTHPFSHDGVACTQPCSKMLPCGHQCGRECSEACICPRCKTKKESSEQSKHVTVDTRSDSAHSSTSVIWQSYAREESARSAETKAATLATRGGTTHLTHSRGPDLTQENSTPKKEMLLIDFDDEQEAQQLTLRPALHAKSDVSLLD